MICEPITVQSFNWRISLEGNVCFRTVSILTGQMTSRDMINLEGGLGGLTITTAT